MTSWQDELPGVLTEKRRWAVLAHLEASQPERSLNLDILIMGTRANGIPTTGDQMEQTVSWLESSELVTVERLAGNMVIVTITRAGREVVQRHRSFPGILPFGLDL